MARFCLRAASTLILGERSGFMFLFILSKINCIFSDTSASGSISSRRSFSENSFNKRNRSSEGFVTQTKVMVTK